MQVPDIFNEVSNQMLSDFNKTRVALSHPGLKGNSSENIVRQFLRDYLPPSLDIATGTIIDSKGSRSRQLDVIIFDAAKTPIFYKSEGVRVIPIECVYSVIEVKAKLDTKELTKVFMNMQSVRLLEKTAYSKTADVGVMLYGKEWDIWPVNYFVFAFESSELLGLAESINEVHQSALLPEWSRIDSVCILDKGVITNTRADAMFDALPSPGSNLYVCHTRKALLLFYSLISQYLFQTCLPNFKFQPYLGKFYFGVDEG